VCSPSGHGPHCDEDGRLRWWGKRLQGVAHVCEPSDNNRTSPNEIGAYLWHYSLP
jgi:hypothetical protein